MEDGTGLSMSMIGSSVNLRFQQLQTSDTSSKGSSQQLLLPASNTVSAKQKCSVPRWQQPWWSLWKTWSSTVFIVVVEWLINIFLTAHSNPVKLRTLARPTNIFHSIHRRYLAIKCLTRAIKSWSSFLSLKSFIIILPEKISPPVQPLRSRRPPIFFSIPTRLLKIS